MEGVPFWMIDYTVKKRDWSNIIASRAGDGDMTEGIAQNAVHTLQASKRA